MTTQIVDVPSNVKNTHICYVLLLCNIAASEMIFMYIQVLKNHF